MTALTSPTNESYSIAYSNPNRLESSGVESTPHDQTTDSKNQYIQFEEYIGEERAKNDLVIVVEDSFDCKIMDVPGMKNKRHTSYENCPSQNQDYSKSESGNNMMKARNLELEQRVSDLEAENDKLLERIECLEQQKYNFVLKHQHFKQIIRKMDQTISTQKQAIENRNLRLSEFQKDNLNIKFYEEKIKEKEGRIRDLMKMTEKLIQINKTLEGEIKGSSEKILALEKEMQLSAYNQILENRVKLKESISNINKENVDQNHRKSFQNPQRKGRLSNISALEKKIKSSSNSGRLKH